MPPIPPAARDPWPGNDDAGADLLKSTSAPGEAPKARAPPPTEEERAARKARRAERKAAQNAEIRARGLYSLESLATALGLSKMHLRRLVHQGKLPAPFYPSPRRPMWRQETIEAWMRMREAERSPRRELEAGATSRDI